MATTPTTSKFPTREGKVPFRGFNTWYRIVGEREEPGRFPLVCLHGGPGMASDYIEPIQDLAATGRRVIFYDQLGCGRSDHPHRPSMWSIGLFVEELATLREALGLERIHLLGQSFGGVISQEYMLTRPQGVVSLTLASSLPSFPLWVAEGKRLRQQLPADVQEVLDRHEAAGTVMDPEYLKACDVFYHRHVCRVVPYPDCVQRTFDQLAEDPEVYTVLNGPNEFLVIGKVKDWDIIPRLGEIRVPTLITSGRHDEATPTIARTLHEGIKGSEWVLFEHSSHMAHVEEPGKFAKVVGDFLGRVEANL